jgi:protocatechuate 3,4-dioxygenase beta subunit
MLTLLIVAMLQVLPGNVPLEPPRGAASIAGRITDATTGEPVAGASVELWHTKVSDLVVTGVPADANGRYRFADLAPGEYSVRAGPRVFRPIYAARFYVDPADPRVERTRIVLKGDERLDHFDVRLPRAYAISGRVIDEWGLPLAGVRIQVRNAASAGNANVRAGPSGTDDRGSFRVPGLDRGRYFVCAQLDRPVEFSTAGSPAQGARLVPTCHPSTLAVSDAQAVTVSDADVDGIEIEVRRARTFSISGVVVTSDGTPAAQQTIRLTQHSENSSWSSGGVIRADGSFSVGGLLPGRYVLEAEVKAGDTTRFPAEAGFLSLQIDSDDLRDVVLATARPARITGRVVSQGGTPVRVKGHVLTVDAYSEPGHSRFGGGGGTSTWVRDDMTFELDFVFGPVQIGVSGLEPDWVVKEVRHKGGDAAYTYTDFADDSPNDVEIVVTNRSATAHGRVTGENGALPPESVVVLIPADPDRRRMRGSVSVVSVARDRTYETRRRPAGDYLLVAVSAPPGLRWSDPRIVDELVPFAERVTLLANERRTVDLRLVTLR